MKLRLLRKYAQLVFNSLPLKTECYSIEIYSNKNIPKTVSIKYTVKEVAPT